MKLSEIHDEFFGAYRSCGWQMEACERATLIQVLHSLSPRCALEVGTAEGGSLSAIAEHAKKVYTLDISHPPELVAELKQRYPNTVFVTGDSKETLPALMRRIEEDRDPLEFVLVDGSHSEEAVKRDLESILTISPVSRIVIMMHDSFNPACRRGMLKTPWQENKYVHFVEIDFVLGMMHERPSLRRQMWGGFALAVLKPEPRQSSELTISQRQRALFDATRQHSVFNEGLPQQIRHLWETRKELESIGGES